MSSGTNRWLVLFAMTGSLSMILLDQTVVSVALPSMSQDLGLSRSGQQWVVNAYVLAMAMLVAVGGKLGDRIGGVTTFRIGVSVFFLASSACGMTPPGPLGEPWIIAARMLQGAGAALMVPVSAAIVVSAFAVAERGRAMATYTGISQVFLAVGPLVGGVLTQTVSWRTVFWLNVPVGIAALIMVQLAGPANIRQSTARIRTRSVVLLLVGIGAFVLGVQQGSTWGWLTAPTLVTIALGLAAAGCFVRRERVAADPLVDVRLFQRPPFLGDVVVLGLVQFALLAVVLYSSIYLQELLHLSPVLSGLGVLPLILALAAAAQIGGRWYDRAGVRPPVLTGLTLCVVGMVAWAAALPTLTYPLQTPGMLLTGLGVGLLMSPTNTDALGRVRATERSGASGVVQTVRQLGGTLGVAIIGSVVVSIEMGSTSSLQQTADAITVGFIAAAVVFGLALIAGWSFLSHEPVSESVDGNDAVSALVD